MTVVSGPFITGKHVRSSDDIATIKLDWKLANGLPAMAYTSPGNVVPDVNVVELMDNNVPHDIPAFVLRGLLTRDECVAIIRAAELLEPSAGEAAAGFMTEAAVGRQYRGRVCTRLQSHDPDMSEFIYSRACQWLPRVIDGGELLGIAPNWRHVHYSSPHGRQEHHCDGREPQPALPMRNGYYRQSRLTIMVYLNTHGIDFEGGATTFLDDRLQPRPGGEYRPVAGDCMVFYQESRERGGPSLLLHEGAAVTAGHKRMMRAMVEYAVPDPEACMWVAERDARERQHLQELDAAVERQRQLPPNHPVLQRKRALQSQARAVLIAAQKSLTRSGRGGASVE